jgi:hypothetical protein
MEAANTVNLSEGIHSLRVAYFQGPRMEVALIFRVAGPGQRMHIFNTDESSRRRIGSSVLRPGGKPAIETMEIDSRIYTRV